jgi:hypothetical protein
MKVIYIGLVLGLVSWLFGLLYICIRWLGLDPKEWVHAMRISWTGRIEEWMVWQAVCFFFLGQVLSLLLLVLGVYQY